MCYSLQHYKILTVLPALDESELDYDSNDENLPQKELGDAARRRLGQRKRDEIKNIISIM